MLWLCISLPLLPLEALRADIGDAATVVTATERNIRWVICCNPAAERAHLKPAMNYTVALAVCPQVMPVERKPQTELAALERLAAWAYQFSSSVILSGVSPDLRQARAAALWLEIGASLKLFGGLRTLLEELETQLQSLHYSYRLGIGPTLEGAALLARARIRVATTSPHALYMRVRSLPITKLPLSPDITIQLHTAGIRTVGLLLELPRDAVAKRFGPQTADLLYRLMGEAADPRSAYRLPDSYAAQFDFGFEISNTETLLFPLSRMLREFAGYLRARDTAVQRFKLVFSHRECDPTELLIGTSLAERNAERFLALVRERLERTELPTATCMLGVYATEFHSPTALQPDLLKSELEHTEDLSHTLDRIAARLGEQQVHGLKSVADHRPEASWSTADFNRRQTSVTFPDRPLWLLPEPRPLQLSAMPKILSGPERIESGWWDSGDVQRDYFVVNAEDGSQLWVFQDLRDSSWYLHGFWS
jgi:protein ImuB